MRYTTLIICLLLSSLGFSQSIKGTVKDQAGKMCTYAEILLISKDGSVVEMVMTDLKGGYDIKLPKDGVYVLHVYNLGVEALLKEVSVEGDVTENVTIDKKIELETVTVTASKKLIENKVDRLVYNVENSLASDGMDVVQVLAKTPMVVANESGVSIAGKSEVAVMINGKMLNLSGNDLMNYLKSLRSEDVAKVEVITTPPAKYEAEGNSGIINIVLKENTKLGWSGNLSATYMQTTYPGFKTNATLNYQSKKVSTSLRLRQYNKNMRATEKIDILGESEVLSDDKRKDTYKGIGANLSLDYKLNEKSNIGFIYDIGHSNNTMDIENETKYRSENTTDSILLTKSDHRKPTLTQTASLYAETKFDQEGTALSFTGNYFSNNPETTVDFETHSEDFQSSNMVKNTSKVNYSIWSTQADFTYPHKWFLLETGTKFTNYSNNSNVAYYDYLYDGFIKDQSKSNMFEYGEQNLAAYVSLNKDFNEKWSAKAGLRYEYSIIDGFSPATQERNENQYGEWFPTAYLAYQHDDNHSFSFNYSKRINRPSFRALNPFRWYTNPLSYYTGNPLLKPSFNHNLELSYGFKGMLNLSVYGQRLIDGYGRTVQLLNEVEKVVNYDNYLTTNSVGLNASLFLDPLNWWDVYVDLNTYYSESKSLIPEVVPQKGLSASYSISNTFTISKKKKIKFLVDYWHSLPAKRRNVNSNSIYDVSAGLRFPLLDEKIRVSLIANDLFRGLVSTGEVYFSDFTQTYNNYYDARRFTLSVSYNFGNDKVKGNKKKIKFDEKRRGS